MKSKGRNKIDTMKVSNRKLKMKNEPNKKIFEVLKKEILLEKFQRFLEHIVNFYYNNIYTLNIKATVTKHIYIYIYIYTHTG